MWLTQQERIILTLLGLVAMMGMGILLWQRQHPPLVVEGAPSPVQAAQWDEALTAAREVDINTANVAELERLPEIGPGLAKRIVEYRSLHGRFATTEDLMQVRGIGPKKYEALKEYIALK